MRARGENDGTTLAQLDDLTRAVVMCDFDASNDRSLANDTKDLGMKLEVEVVESLCIREDISNGTTTKAIADLSNVSFVQVQAQVRMILTSQGGCVKTLSFASASSRALTSFQPLLSRNFDMTSKAPSS